MDRLQRIVTIRETLSSGDASLGSWLQIPHPEIAEILGDAGYDWVAIDLEHGSISIESIPSLCRALELGRTLPLARVASHQIEECRRALDAGVGGVIVPGVEKRSVLENIRDACCWPPAGIRGVGFSRANLYGKYFQEYSEEAQAPLLVAQIESSTAVDNLAEIASVEGLDAVFVGPYDLSASLGYPGDFDHPLFLQAIEQILGICVKAQIPAGIHIIEPDEEKLRAALDQGYRFIAYSIDSVMLRLSARFPSL